MAEAHQAVSYSELIKNEHTETNHAKEVLKLVWVSGLRSWKKRIARSKNKIRNGVYPAHLESLWVIMGVVMGFHFSSMPVPFELVNVFIKLMPDQSIGWQTVTCCLAGFVYWGMICLVMRYTLKGLLMYKGFMFETRGRKVSMTTKIWAVLVKVFVKWNTPSLFSFQGSLPHLPLPRVKDTLRRYLDSMRPILDDEDYERVKKQAKEFENGISRKLQWYLVLKSWWSSNYVSDWWEEYVYLRGRSPLMVNSNYYGSDCMSIRTNNQTARAASLTYQWLQFRKKIERQEMKPIMVQGLVPLCSWQYERMFNTVRTPGVEGDKIVHYEDIKYITVLHKGCYYKVMIYHKGRLLNACELKHQFDSILKNNEKSSHSEEYLASLTAWNRTKWAEARDKFFSSGVNKESLHIIESSAFLLIFDDRPLDFDETGEYPEKFDSYGHQCLYGKIYDRWFDKSFCVCFGTNGRFALCAEHTWADAPVMGHLFEEACYDDMNSYDESGNLLGRLEMEPPTPIRLKWEFSAELTKTIDEAYGDACQIVKNVDHKLVNHNQFGKGFIKTCRVSPDAYIQMALQLAYFCDFGKFSQTYEASMTRLYREGRTETVRPCTIESSAWVRAMDNKNSNTSEKIKLFQAACDRHQQGYLDAMCGRGIDRHLFCLYVVSKYLEVESPFLKEAISEPWRLSTSQTPHGQTPKIDLKKFPELTTPGGGFGPVSHDGYSVSYIISGENNIFFHVSSNGSCSITSTERFTKRIFKAMMDIKILFDEFNSLKKSQGAT